MKAEALVPKLFTTMRGYTRRQFVSDATAGVIVGVVALPLCIAFAIASGVTPERGLYTGIVAGFLISTLGGSRVRVGGPTGAFVVILAGIVAQYGVDGLIVATLMAGFLLVGMGLLKLGGVIKFIPFPVTTGFTAGIALIIFSQQVKDLLGLRIETVPAEFFGKWASYVTHFGSINPATALLSAGTVAVQVLGLDVETIGSRFGVIDASLPSPHWPVVTEKMLRDLTGPAFTIAILGAIESLRSAVVADGMIGSRHRSNMELVAPGVANIVSPLFGGIPATGAIARTATNVRNGGGPQWPESFMRSPCSPSRCLPAGMPR